MSLAEPWLVVVSGVSGVGKTAVGEALARRLGVPYADGDSFHSADCVAKMASGVPLDERDREPWLARVAAWLTAHQASGAVVSCSALSRRHRDVLARAGQAVVFLQLVADPALIRTRLLARKHHFMPASLLASQLATLDPLQDDERGLTLDIASMSPSDVAEAFVGQMTERADVEGVAVDPLDGELDLHTFRPEETAELVRDYVMACHEKGVLALRIVHGKGKGTLRRTVHHVLSSMPEVASFRLSEPLRGGWGATLVELHPKKA